MYRETLRTCRMSYKLLKKYCHMDNVERKIQPIQINNERSRLNGLQNFEVRNIFDKDSTNFNHFSHNDQVFLKFKCNYGDRGELVRNAFFKDKYQIKNLWNGGPLSKYEVSVKINGNYETFYTIRKIFGITFFVSCMPGPWVSECESEMRHLIDTMSSSKVKISKKEAKKDLINKHKQNFLREQNAEIENIKID